MQQRAWNFLSSGKIIEYKTMFSKTLASGEHAYGEANEVWPEYNGQHALPESEVQKTNREKPSRKPRKCWKAMIFNFYLIHESIISCDYMSVY